MQFPQPIHMYNPYAPFPAMMPCTPQYPHPVCWAPGPPIYNAAPMMPPNCNAMHLMPPTPPMPLNYGPIMHQVFPSPLRNKTCYHDPRDCYANMRPCAGNSESLYDAE